MSENLKIELNSHNAEKCTFRSFLVFFAWMIAFQSIMMFQGIDLADTGSYMTFYQQFFRDPQSVYYYFMYWLSGLFGGIFLKLFPFAGLLGIRLLGTIVYALTIFLVFRILRPYVVEKSLKWSILFVTLLLNNVPREFYYNNFSALLYILAIGCLFNGIIKDKNYLIFISGTLISLNFFNRFPNIIEIGLAGGIIFWGILNKSALNIVAKRIGWMMAGFFTSTIIVLLMMDFLGHLTLYADTLGILKKLAYSESKDVKVRNYYGFSLLFRTNLSHWAHGIVYFLMYTFFLLISFHLIKRIQNSLKYSGLLVWTITIALIAIPMFMLVEKKINNDTLTLFFYGLNIVGGILLILSDRRNPVKLITFFGLYYLLSYPAGSSEGVLMAGVYAFWIITPLVFNMIHSFKFPNNHISINQINFKFSIISSYPKNQLNNLINVATITGFVLLCYFNYFYPHSDRHNRMQMNSPLKHPFLKGIYTVKERAIVLNELMDASNQYVKPGDAVLAYDCIALYHYLSETRPFSRNPWPWLYQSEVFKKELEWSEQKEKNLPIIVQQLKGTIGNEKDWPTRENAVDYLNLDINRSRNDVLQNFILKHQYKQVWTNGFFQILKANGHLSKNK